MGHGCLYPRIEVRDQEVFCDGRPLGLCRKPLMRRLFSVFSATPHGTIARHDLLASVYEQDRPFSYSERYRQSASQNLVKLISRARRYAAQAAQDWEWFVYDAPSGRWSLCRVKGGPGETAPSA